jgi:hypothetical protein
MPSSWMLRRVVLEMTDISEEPSPPPIIGVTIIGERETMLAVTSNRLLDVTFQNTTFFIGTTLKTSNLIYYVILCFKPPNENNVEQTVIWKDLEIIYRSIGYVKLTLNFVDKWRLISRYSSLAD